MNGGNPRNPSAVTISGPRLRKIQRVGRRNTNGLVRQRHRDRDLAVRLLAEGTAALMGDARGVAALLGKLYVNSTFTSYINDPSGHRAVTLHGIEHELPGHPQHGRIVPSCIGDQVVHGLVACTHLPRIKSRRHWFHALALTRQAKGSHISPQGFVAVGMTYRFGQTSQVLSKTPLDRRGVGLHALMMSHRHAKSRHFMTR